MSRSPFLRRLALVSGTAAALALGPVALSAALTACGGDATTGERIILKTQITADAEATQPFTNAYGWTIHLTKALVSVGPLYYFDGAPIFTAGRAPRPRLRELLGVRAAHAHPGHYQPGNAMGEETEASSADLLQGVTALPTGNGVTGVFRSGTFTFGDPPKGALAADLGGHAVVLEGKAEKDTMTRLFRAVADVGDVLDSYGEPKLEGCAFADEPTLAKSGTVTVHVKPSIWLDQAEFDDVAESTDGQPVTLTPDEEAFKAFARGLKKGSAVSFSYGS